MTEPNRNDQDKKNPFDEVVGFVKNTKDRTEDFEPEDIEKNKTVATLCYLPILFFLPLVASPQSHYGRFHANQSLILLLVSAAVSVILFTVRVVFSLGFTPVSFVFNLLSQFWGLVVLVMVILGIINAANGKAKELPLIGKWTILSN